MLGWPHRTAGRVGVQLPLALFLFRLAPSPAAAGAPDLSWGFRQDAPAACLSSLPAVQLPDVRAHNRTLYSGAATPRPAGGTKGTGCHWPSPINSEAGMGKEPGKSFSNTGLRQGTKEALPKWVLPVPAPRAQAKISDCLAPNP